MDREQIFRLLRARIVGWATSRVGRAKAEDIAHEVLVVLTEKYAHLERLEDLLPLSFRILEHKVRNARRLAARRREGQEMSIEDLSESSKSTPSEEKRLSPPPVDPVERLLEQEEHQLLRDAMSRLKPACRKLFRLLFEGTSQARISKELDEPVGTIYARHSRCKEQLQGELHKLLRKRETSR